MSSLWVSSQRTHPWTSSLEVCCQISHSWQRTPVKPLIHQSDTWLSNSLHFTFKQLGWHSQPDLDWSVSLSPGRTVQNGCWCMIKPRNLVKWLRWRLRWPGTRCVSVQTRLVAGVCRKSGGRSERVPPLYWIKQRRGRGERRWRRNERQEEEKAVVWMMEDVWDLEHADKTKMWQ